MSTGCSVATSRSTYRLGENHVKQRYRIEKTGFIKDTLTGLNVGQIFDPQTSGSAFAAVLKDAGAVHERVDPMPVLSNYDPIADAAAVRARGYDGRKYGYVCGYGYVPPARQQPSA